MFNLHLCFTVTCKQCGPLLAPETRLDLRDAGELQALHAAKTGHRIEIERAK